MDELRPGDFLAPDGIIIRPIVGADSPLVSVVSGVIPPRDDDYPIHLHYALEQITYVIRGALTAISRGPNDGAATEVALQSGQSITTPPATTLAFRNSGREPAEVLFICVPPYPATNSDTKLIGESDLAPTARELGRAAERQRRAQQYLSAVMEARLQALRWLDASDEP